MPKITLPDGSCREFDHAVSVMDVANSIGAGLAKATLAGRVDGKVVDASFMIEADTSLVIITEKSPEALEIIRHSCAHLLAQAVKQLYPSAQVTIGPVIENGFYYDFAFERPFTPEDLDKIEKRMEQIQQENLPIVRKEVSRHDAISVFANLGEDYKVEIIRDLPEDETLSMYQQGDFEDLCRGPHVPSTAKTGAFKLMKVAGAYWRGDSNNEMLQRIYGTAWADKKALKAYLHQLEEAEKRDHRKLAKALDLFHFQEEAPGMVFWHPRGFEVYKAIERYMRARMRENNYQEIRTPQIMDRSLWEKSGHWQKFGEQNMFVTHSENRDYAIKPMNCPGHVQVFRQGLKSYRDLPLRLSEFGVVHRNEPSGALHGLMRVRSFTQDDAHAFCTPDQIREEVSVSIDLILSIYKDFGFTECQMLLSTRPEERIGSDAVWDKAEKALAEALDDHKLDWSYNPGEGAFYGPKIEFSLKDCLGRIWQCGTIQVDFSMPGRLGAEYVAEDGERRHPVMIHRAIFGSLERFIGILIEHHEGRFPLWLSPEQVLVMNITDRQAEYCQNVAKNLQNLGFRVISDLRNEKIGFKIREHTLQRVPYLVIVGDREAETQELAVRTREGEDLGTMSLEVLVEKLNSQVQAKQ
ncbi:MAG: threonine--tRNA ligase [Gammaproteobacteria bacterium CG11_big_fil_rev_8_21_14_0_20_46_22]|nr:MAG: threonine--tRNA ligase [Gammaproteobacteria bacterium CG12_big_fil_rev_8_21_14_0_65_46_12]PIR11576.1 MAG: threonine--tRNA ligase [Gammaproteobacteria bacterium CG11_big_fil_rev_8_21_14_0_20_46_22]